MSKKKKKARAAGPDGPPRARRRHPTGAKVAAVIALTLCLAAAAGTAALRWGSARRAAGLAPAAAPAPPQQPLQLSKEYIYAGGRLVAAEEPTSTSAGPTPTGLVAALASANPPAASVTVTWSPPEDGGTVASYVVERASVWGQFAPVGQPVAAPATSFNDTGAAEGAAYLYRVKANFAAGGSSTYSNTDLATSVLFTDDPLIGANDPQGRPATTIYARHLTELRRAVSAVRLLAGLGAVTTWTHLDPVSSPPERRRAIYLEDVKELRDRLGEALAALGRAAPSYVDPTLERYVTKVKKEHFQQLRDAVK